MPIYAYRCQTCGFSKDVLQKLSDTPLSQCPQCHQTTFQKQVTAAGFQLKGSGWYVTDFKNNQNQQNNTSAKAANSASNGETVTKSAETQTSPQTTTNTESAASATTANTTSTTPANTATDNNVKT